MQYLQPVVELISQADSRAKSWQHSRPYLDHDSAENEVLEVQKMDLPIGAFLTHHFYVKSSLLFRDLIFSLRPAVIWARSQRTVPLTVENMNMSSEYEFNHEFNQKKIDLVLTELSQGVPQDFAKKKLPMGFVTEFTISMDDRSLVNFLHSLKINCKELYEIYGPLFLKAINQDETHLDRKMQDIFPKYAMNQEELDAATGIGQYHEVLDTIILANTMQLSLFSQYLRQHYSNIKSELWNLIKDKGLCENLCCDDEIRAVLYANKTAFKKVITARTCFFGMWDSSDSGSWNHILEPVVKNMSVDEFKENLPCKGCGTGCTIRGDMIPRVKLIEVNPPCAILIENPDTIRLREEKYNPTSVIFQKWKELGSTIEFNPNNELNKLYQEHLVANDGKDAEGYQVIAKV